MAVTDLTGTTWIFNETLSTLEPVRDVYGYILINFYYGDYRNGDELIPFSTIDGSTNNSSTLDLWGTIDSDWWDTHGDIYIPDFTPTSVGDEYAEWFQDEVIPAYNDITLYSQEWPSAGGADTWFTSNRTITIMGGEHATLPQLITWLEANAVQQGGSDGVTITYDGETVTTIDEDGTTTLPTNGKCMATDVVVSGNNVSSATIAYNGNIIATGTGTFTKTLQCANKMMVSNVTVTVVISSDIIYTFENGELTISNAPYEFSGGELTI